MDNVFNKKIVDNNKAAHIESNSIGHLASQFKNKITSEKPEKQHYIQKCYFCNR